MNSIEVINLTKKFGDFISVNNISFNVKKGETFGFLGANGAGKSTTIRMLIGILEPTSGDALVNGYSIKNDPDMVKKTIGYMSQRFSLYNDLTVEENINFFGGVYGLSGKELNDRKSWVLKISNLENQKSILTGSLPGGIKQRLALGTSLIHRPPIVFLDEPTSGVDPISRRSFWELINELSEQGTTIFVTTHYLEEAEFCNNIILINAGNLIAEGNPTELKSKYISGSIYKIESKNIIDSMSILQQAPFVQDVSIFGNFLHILTEKDVNLESELKRLSNENSELSIKSVHKIVPTLEDVFIHLLEKDNKK